MAVEGALAKGRPLCSPGPWLQTKAWPTQTEVSLIKTCEKPAPPEQASGGRAPLASPRWDASWASGVWPSLHTGRAQRTNFKAFLINAVSPTCFPAARRQLPGCMVSSVL